METKDMIELLNYGREISSQERLQIALHLQTLAERLREADEEEGEAE